jgi:hypothetical protein
MHTQLNFGKLERKGYVGDLGVHERILLKLILEKYCESGN